jgi:dTDP-4-amino-4,6-dideoxygalactose transaminase
VQVARRDSVHDPQALDGVRQLESLVALHQGRAELALRLQNALVDVEELTSDM